MDPKNIIIVENRIFDTIFNCWRFSYIFSFEICPFKPPGSGSNTLPPPPPKKTNQHTSPPVSPGAASGLESGCGDESREKWHPPLCCAKKEIK